MGIMSEKENQIIVYQPNETVRLDVRLENETVWLNQSRLGDLFDVDRTVINRHVHNIYKTGELEMDATCAKIAQVQNEGGRSITRMIPFYNLDMIIAVGYRVNSLQATRFRQWARSASALSRWTRGRLRVSKRRRLGWRNVELRRAL